MTDCPLERNDDGKWCCPICGWEYKHITKRPPRRNCPESKRAEAADGAERSQCLSGPFSAGKAGSPKGFPFQRLVLAVAGAISSGRYMRLTLFDALPAEID